MIFDPVDARKLLEMGVPQWRVALKYDIHRRTLMRRLDERTPCTQASIDLLEIKNSNLEQALIDLKAKLDEANSRTVSMAAEIANKKSNPVHTADAKAKYTKMVKEKNIRISTLTSKINRLEAAAKKKVSGGAVAAKQIKRLDAKNQVLERKIRSLQREIDATHGGETEELSLTPLMGAFFQNNNQDLMNHNVKVVTLTQEEVDRSNRIGRI